MPVDAYLVVQHRKSPSEIVPEPTGDFAYSSRNHQGVTSGGSSDVITINPNVNVGTGGNIANILRDNGVAIESIKEALKSGIKIDNISDITTKINDLATKSDTNLKSVVEALNSQKTTSSADLKKVGDYINSLSEKSDTNLKNITQSLDSRNENQAQTNQHIVNNLGKQNEHYEYMKTPSITDSNGHAHSPRDAHAKASAEHYVDKSGINQTDFGAGINDVLDLMTGSKNEEDNLFTSLLNKLKELPFSEISKIDEALILKKEN